MDQADEITVKMKIAFLREGLKLLERWHILPHVEDLGVFIGKNPVFAFSSGRVINAANT